ncbi:ankyrin repeat-containing domain protein, partial [Blyttiomyces helicus]
WDAWNSLGDYPRRAALDAYILLVEKHTNWWRDQDDDETPPSSSADAVRPDDRNGMGSAVSTLASAREGISDKEKTIFDWAEEGSSAQVLRLIDSQKVDLNGRDKEGMTVLHWAADRGHLELTQAMLARGANADAQDHSKQTPLHYALSVENMDVARVLVAAGASLTLRDEDGLTPLEVATDVAREALQNKTP